MHGFASSTPNSRRGERHPRTSKGGGMTMGGMADTTMVSCSGGTSPWGQAPAMYSPGNNFVATLRQLCSKLAGTLRQLRVTRVGRNPPLREAPEIQSVETSPHPHPLIVNPGIAALHSTPPHSTWPKRPPTTLHTLSLIAVSCGAAGPGNWKHRRRRPGKLRIGAAGLEK